MAMVTPHMEFEEGAYVAHTGTDVYGPGRVIGVDGDLRRVRFVHFVATIAARDLRTATPDEEAQMRAWLRQKVKRYGGRW
ncbi:hypothetical protein [Streptomyces jeddahensis]|uniref:Uncharacterized protein n=1 Tax=Streptomyces jeddahensis TaxID=1716141 RepID=A0A177HQL7_9ACTN|nr:hypothetical protein [Streptomyces jeddahensis]OAH13185.1 hypothetical protein STSP_35100 [Streptomyces jeddahensis]